MNQASRGVVIRLRKPLKLAKIPKGVDSPIEVLIWKVRSAGAWGLANRAIKAQLGVSDSQIYKILKAYGIKRKHYRNAERMDLDISKKYPTAGGLIALEVLERIEWWSERKLLEELQKQMLR